MKEAATGEAMAAAEAMATAAPAGTFGRVATGKLSQ